MKKILFCLVLLVSLFAFGKKDYKPVKVIDLCPAGQQAQWYLKLTRLRSATQDGYYWQLRPAYECVYAPKQ